VQKSSIRSYQDRAANSGWRIKLIPHDDPSKTIWYPTNWYALAGMTVFCIGIVGLGSRVSEPIQWLVVAGGFGFALLSFPFLARARRRGWLRVKAACLDRECHGGVFRLRCTFYLKDADYTVTPAPFWREFSSEEILQRFLGKLIDKNGMCWLRVNPRNPLQTEIAAGDIAEKLLFPW
jgi:hypothetical protein